MKKIKDIHEERERERIQRNSILYGMAHTSSMFEVYFPYMPGEIVPFDDLPAMLP